MTPRVRVLECPQQLVENWMYSEFFLEFPNECLLDGFSFLAVSSEYVPRVRVQLRRGATESQEYTCSFD